MEQRLKFFCHMDILYGYWETIFPKKLLSKFRLMTHVIWWDEFFGGEEPPPPTVL